MLIPKKPRELAGDEIRILNSFVEIGRIAIQRMPLHKQIELQLQRPRAWHNIDTVIAAWTKDKVLEHMKAESGKHFDPQVLDAFLRMKEVANDL